MRSSVMYVISLGKIWLLETTDSVFQKKNWKYSFFKKISDNSTVKKKTRYSRNFPAIEKILEHELL